MADIKPVKITLSFTPKAIEKYEATSLEYPDGHFRHTPAFTAYGVDDGHGSYWTVEVPDVPLKGVSIDVAK